MRVIVFDDNGEEMNRIVRGIRWTVAHYQLDVSVDGFREEWLNIAQTLIGSGEKQVWIVDIRTEIQQKGKAELREWIENRIREDEDLGRIYKSERALRRMSHNGLGIAILARDHRIPFRILSQITSVAPVILSYLVVGDHRPTSWHEWSFEKTLLLRDDVDHPKVQEEYRRLVDFIRSVDGDDGDSRELERASDVVGISSVIEEEGVDKNSDERKLATQGCEELARDDGSLSSSLAEGGAAPTPKSDAKGGGDTGGRANPVAKRPWWKKKGILGAIGTFVVTTIMVLGAIAEIRGNGLLDLLRPGPLKIEVVRVSHAEKDLGAPLIDIKTSPKKERYVGDRVSVDVQMSHDAYLLLMALNPDGTIKEIFSSREGEASKILHFPENSKDAHFLTTGGGQQAFTLLASRRGPLSFNDWEYQLGLAWRKTMAKGVWECDGNSRLHCIPPTSSWSPYTNDQTLAKVCTVLERSSREEKIEAAYLLSFSVEDAYR